MTHPRPRLVRIGRLLALWGAIAITLELIAYFSIDFLHEAASYVLVNDVPPNNILSNHPTAGHPPDAGGRMETLALRMTAPDILGMALKDEKVAALPRIRSAMNADALLREELRVEVVTPTRYIKVSLTSPSPSEAAAIVNAVTRVYEEAVESTSRAEALIGARGLEKFLEEITREVEANRSALHQLVKGIGESDEFLAKTSDDGRAGPRAAFEQHPRREDLLAIELARRELAYWEGIRNKLRDAQLQMRLNEVMGGGREVRVYVTADEVKRVPNNPRLIREMAAIPVVSLVAVVALALLPRRFARRRPRLARIEP